MTNNVFTKRQKIYLPFKRLFDILFSLLMILFLSWFLLIVGIAVWIDTKAFPIFRQRRIGRNNKEFLILKFRSLKKDTPKEMPSTFVEGNNQYMSKFGHFIRKYSIDELPQLFNIFIGQMSFIGPRPILWKEVEFIEMRNKMNIYSIKPGLSGWAQCNGRNKISISEKVNLDYEYLCKFNVWFDLKIFFLSIGRAISHKDFN